MFGGPLTLNCRQRKRWKNVFDGRLLKPSRRGGKQRIQWTKTKMMRRLTSSWYLAGPGLFLRSRHPTVKLCPLLAELPRAPILAKILVLCWESTRQNGKRDPRASLSGTHHALTALDSPNVVKADWCIFHRSVRRIARHALSCPEDRLLSHEQGGYKGKA
jgi:hypothetical protein